MQSTTINRPFTAVLVGGGIAATFDITYAIIRNGGYGRSPLWVLQSVASGWLGTDAFTSGVQGGILGLLSHYFILFVAAALYLIVSRRVPILRSQALICGALFGVLVYLFMNFVLLPVSAFPFHPTFPFAKLAEGFFSHAVLVGLPIAMAVRRFISPA